jgi:AcrR family transcriptional regulator
LLEYYSNDMDPSVKDRPGRRELAARRTRTAILAAARTLFVDAGYGSTSIAAIADAAGVAVQTVYAVFGNKRSILTELLDRAIAGDDRPIAVNDRDWMQLVWEAPTAIERLEAYATAVARIMDAAGDVFVVVASAATVDPDAAELARTAEARRRTGATRVVESVMEVGTLRSGLTEPQAIDILWLLNSPAVFDQLVRRSGWPLDAYRSWLADAFVQQLLGPAAAASPARG